MENVSENFTVDSNKSSYLVRDELFNGYIDGSVISGVSGTVRTTEMADTEKGYILKTTYVVKEDVPYLKFDYILNGSVQSIENQLSNFYFSPGPDGTFRNYTITKIF